MSDFGDVEQLRPRLRVMQIVCLALILGALIFLGIALFMVLTERLNPRAGLPFVSLMGLALLVVDGPLAIILPGVMARSAVKKIAAGTSTPPVEGSADDLAGDDMKLLAVRQTTLIVGLALWEALAYMSGIAYMLEGQSFVLAIAGVAILFMLGSFPTMRSVRVWLERQRPLIEEIRQRT